MKLFLASYKYGAHQSVAQELFGTCDRIGVISNALDTPPYLELRSQKVEEAIHEWKKMGLNAEEIDLRDFVGKNSELEEYLTGFDGVWVRGGNCFELRLVMQESGFDKVINQRLQQGSIIYGGYSAGVCILGKTLRGLELCDDIDSVQSAHNRLIWDGLGVIGDTIVPHYKSDHPESADIDRVIEYLDKNNIGYIALRDSQVLVVDGDRQEILQ